MTQQRANHWLDVCRALAIMLVLFSHGRHLLIPLWPEAQWLKFGGFLGVEVFFVLSGFLIGRILIEQSEAAGSAFGWVPRFWARRWLRTYPNYVLFLLLNVWLLDSIRPESVAPDLLHYFTFTQSLWWPHPSFFAEAWSLAIEELFYFLVPLLMLLLWPLTGGGARALLAALAVLWLGSFGARVLLVLTEPALTFNEVRSTALLRLDSIMTGVLAAWCCWRGGVWHARLQRAAPWLACLLVPVVLVAAAPDYIMDESALLKVVLFPLANLGAAGLMITGLKWRFPRWLHVPLERVARWSYSAYLANLPVLLLILYLRPESAIGWLNVLWWLGFMAGTLLLSALVYSQFERRVMALRDKKFREQRAVPLYGEPQK